MLKQNEIIRIYGTDYLAMTRRILEEADLTGEIEEKAKILGKDAKELKITLKPNLIACIPAKFGATTHLEVTEGVLSYLRERGFRNLTIAEGSWVGDRTEEALEILGYNELARKYDVRVVDTQKDSWYETEAAGMKLLLCDVYKDTEFLINCPVLKGHCQTLVTCALKNMKGLIPNQEKRRFHTLGLHKPIAYLNKAIHQDFIVIDHICGDPGFEEGGNPLVTNCVMAAKDPVLTDAFTADTLGYGPEEIGYIGIAESLGIGTADLSELELRTLAGTEEAKETIPRDLFDVSYRVEAADSCSACYALLLAALRRLKEEGLLDRLTDKIAIGQGHVGKTGVLGCGNCTRNFETFIPGCPPSEERIYEMLKERILSRGIV